MKKRLAGLDMNSPLGVAWYIVTTMIEHPDGEEVRGHDWFESCAIRIAGKIRAMNTRTATLTHLRENLSDEAVDAAARARVAVAEKRGRSALVMAEYAAPPIMAKHREGIRESILAALEQMERE